MKLKILLTKLNKVARFMLVFLGLSCAFLNAPVVLADNGNKEHTILLSPTDATFDVEAGKSYTGSFGIYNTGQVDFDFKVYTEPFSLKDGCTQDFITKSDQTQLASWIKLEQTNYSLKAGQKVVIKYRIDVPNNIPAGGQYAVIFSETGTGQSGMISGTKRLGYKIYVHTNGETTLRGLADDFKIDNFKFDNKLVATATVKNNGNTDFVANGVMEVKNLFGQTVYAEELPLRVLPNGNCALKTTWTKAPIFGLFKTTLTVKLLDQVYTKDAWTVVVSPVVIGVLVLVILVIIMWSHYGRTKRHY